MRTSSEEFCQIKKLYIGCWTSFNAITLSTPYALKNESGGGV